jgi:hypothetical protein
LILTTTCKVRGKKASTHTHTHIHASMH